MSKVVKLLISIIMILTMTLACSACSFITLNGEIEVISVEKTNSEGLVDTYTVTMSDDSTYTFQVTNGAQGSQGEVGATGAGIDRIELTSSQGNTDTYTIYLTNGSEYTFSVVNDRKDYGEVESITIPLGVLYVKKGATAKINLDYSGDNFDKSLIEWNCSNSDVLVSDGVVYGFGTGNGIITATYGNLTAICYVIALEDQNADFTLSDTNITMETAQSVRLEVLNNGQRYDYVNWSVQDVGVANVQDGVVTAEQSGVTVVKATVHGQELVCKVVVGGVDGNLDEWFSNGKPIYNGVELSDLYHAERKFVAYARITDSTIYFAGYAYHSTHVSGEDLWYQNTNFEVFLNQNNKAIQYYASNGFVCPGAKATYIKTELNPNSVGAFDKCLTIFELSVDVDCTAGYVKAGFAFKVPGEYITVVRGGQSPILDSTDWWWSDLHYPSNLSEMYYVYSNGISGGVK